MVQLCGLGGLQGLIELDGGGGTGQKGPGPWAQYILGVDVGDLVPPRVTGVSPLPGNNGHTDKVVDRLTVTFSKDMNAAPINAMSRQVWYYGGHAYLLTDNSVSWMDAEAQAQSLGGHLVTINDAGENEWVRATFSSAYGNLWIGLTDQAAEGSWEWSSGQALGYSNWASGQPDNWDSWWGGDADYAWLQSDGRWADFGGSATTRGLIELEGVDSDGDGIPDVIDPYPLDALNNFDLRAAGADGAFDTADDVIYRLRVDPLYTSGTSVGLLMRRAVGQRALSVHGQQDAFGSIWQRAGRERGWERRGRLHAGLRCSLAGRLCFRRAQRRHSSDCDRPAAGGRSAGQRAVDGRGMGTVQTSSDQDWWSFSASAGDIVSVSVDRYQDSGLRPYAYLYNSNGGGLTGDYNGGPNYGAFISHYSIPASGTYYISVSEPGYGTTGAYQMHVELARGFKWRATGPTPTILSRARARSR